MIELVNKLKLAKSENEIESICAEFGIKRNEILIGDTGGKIDAGVKIVTGNVDVYRDSKLDAPALQTVGGSVDVSGSAKLDALQTVGGNVGVSGSAKLDALKESNTYAARTKAKEALETALEKKGLILADGILSHIVHKRENIVRVRRVGRADITYLVQDGEYYAHGATLEKAMADLRYKRSSRDISQFKAWGLKTEVSLEDAILAY